MLKRSAPVEKRRRSVVKSLTFRILVITSDTFITYALTHRADLTAGFVIFTNLASTVLYYTHERVWSHIRWAKAEVRR